MSRYEPTLTAAAVRDLERLAPKIVAPLLAFVVGGLADHPHRRGKPLQRELEGRWSARRGDYRVIYRLDDDTQTMFVLRIAHRAEVYRPR